MESGALTRVGVEVKIFGYDRGRLCVYRRTDINTVIRHFGLIAAILRYQNTEMATITQTSDDKIIQGRSTTWCLVSVTEMR